MTFATPQAFLLLVPLALVLWARGLPVGLTGWLRAVLALLLVVALAEPSVRVGGAGVDLLVVVDRSASMPAGSDARALETIGLLEKQRGSGDRLGVVSFGRNAHVERPSSASDSFGGFQREVSGDASELSRAFERVEELASADRTTRVLLLSDGDATGGDALAGARRLAQRGIPIDVRPFDRKVSGDVAVERLELPPQVDRGEPFQLSAVVHATADVERAWVLKRGGQVLSRGTAKLHPGPNRLLLRDRLDAAGIAAYSFELEGSDAVTENDRSRAVVRVAGTRRVLVIRANGRHSALAQALSSGGFDVTVSARAPDSLEALDDVGVVVLENVPASLVGERGLRVLGAFVRDAGGGLLVTGGERAFGQGGYHKSALDELLPVSMELRQEQRKASIALGISMDRSGSMGATTLDGVPKMTLAAEGAVSALELLGKGDSAAVWVVDTRAHTVFPLTKVEEGLSLDLVASVKSEGGGIYIEEAIAEAAGELRRAPQKTRHLILFADAADSEEPGDYKALLSAMRKEGMTVSVIGLGTEQDPDAELLKDIAKRGEGRIYFTQSAQELPRLFSEETIVLARASIIRETTGIRTMPEAAQLGALPSVPSVGGYNLTYLRPEGSALLRTADDESAPILSIRQAGLGRTAAFTTEADGELSGGLLAWSGYGSLFARVVRRLMPPADPTDVLAKVRLAGDGIEVVVETEDDVDASGATALLVSGDGESRSSEVPLRQRDAHRLVARFPLDRTGSVFPVVRLGQRVVRVAPVGLPYAPEFEPVMPGAGRALLGQIASVTGGVERLSLDGLFVAAGARSGRRSIASWFVAPCVMLLVLEVAARRLGWRLPSFAWPRPRAGRAPVVAHGEQRAPARRETPPVESPSPRPEPVPAVVDDVGTALEKAREKARKRLR